jgi:predicted negative regulator of RcsB-dependent stress response
MNGHEHLKHVARVRLAQVLLYQGKPEEVLSLLEEQENEAFAARYAAALGDAYFALSRYDEARASYQAALGETQPTVNQGLIQLKLMDLPENGGGAVQDEAEAAAVSGEDGGE